MVKNTALAEITLRKYEKPYNLNRREIVKKICLSLGILQEGDSRDVIVDILLVLFNAVEHKKILDEEEIKNETIVSRNGAKLELKGIADSNIRRQLKKLRDLMIVEKQNNGYRISEFQSLSLIFEEKIEKFLIPQITDRVKEYLDELEKT